jgi:hypothetical protein
MMAIAVTSLKTGAIAGVEHGLAGIGNEHHRAADNVDELVLMRVPVALAGPGARAQLQEINTELGKSGGESETTPGLVLAGLVERLGVTRSGALTGIRDVDLHLPVP